MNVVQAWLVIGLPALLLALTCLVGRSPGRAALGYLALAGGFLGMALVDRVSAGVFGGLLVLVYAAGRGGWADHAVNDTEATLARHRDVQATGRH